MTWRIRFVFFFFLLIFATAAGRLFFLQVIHADYYKEQVQEQSRLETTVQPKRGTIYAHAEPTGADTLPVAFTKRMWNVWVVPKNAEPHDRERIAASLAAVLNVDKSIVLERLSKENDPYEPVKDRVSEEEYERIRDIAPRVVYADETEARYYPFDTFAAHILGFVSRKDADPVGQYGLEGFYEKALSGITGYVEGIKNPLGFLIRPFSTFARPEDGADLYTTIDYNVQLALERELASALTDYAAEAASGIVLDPHTGRVIAMASTPTFSPNSYESENIAHFINPLTQKLFEPGSIFKPITMAIGLNTNVISPDMTYRDEGFVTVADVTIKNSIDEPQGVQAMTDVLEKSLNTGAVFVAGRVPRGVWREYLEKFGLSGKTGIDLAGEVESTIENVRSGGEVEQATSAFGQGIAVTPIAMTRAIAAVANGGMLVEPFIVEEVDQGGIRNVTEPKVQRIIREDVADAVTTMMVSVVERGSGRLAQIDGYSVAGKTGTAQVPDPRGGYSERVIHSFVGFAPAFDPRFVVLVTLDNPQSSRFSEATAAPVFKSISEFILRYYNIDPDKPLGN